MVGVGVVPNGSQEKPKPKHKVINKLFLIGNGFDLSLGLKTRYEDFLFWYLKGFLEKSICCYQKISHSQSNGYLYHEDDILSSYNHLNQFFDDLFKKKFNDKKNSIEDLKNFIDNGHYEFNYKFKSTLFEKIYDASKTGWIDIEKIFYDQLILEVANKGKSLDNLNSELKIILSLLKAYLETLDYSVSENDLIANHYINHFVKDIRQDEIIDKNPNLPIVTNQMLFLNFNYTPALSNIINFIPRVSQGKFNHENCKLNHIHGAVNSIENDLIFGYGDEMDDRYKEIENLHDNRYLENFKSFKYNHSSNYRDLLRFLNANDYQVCIYGHSCGLSDRVMLNEIFEHDNCKSIKIYFYNKEEFINKNMDISRHFNSNKIMRQRIVEFNLNDQIPQMIK